MKLINAAAVMLMTIINIHIDLCLHQHQ